jgi:dolichol-phosphate mannosyltransferase
MSVWKRRRAGSSGLTALAIDALIFETLFELGVGQVSAQTVSFGIASIFGYILNSRTALAGIKRDSSDGAWLEATRFIAICLMAFALRGGVIAGAVGHLGWSSAIAILPGALAAAIVSYLGNVFFVFRSVTWQMPTATRWRLAALGVVAYVMALRLAFLGLVNLLPEEAYYWNYSQHPDIGYLDHPPMVAWLIWLGTSVFGNTEFGVRIGSQTQSVMKNGVVVGQFFYRVGYDYRACSTRLTSCLAK